MENKPANPLKIFLSISLIAFLILLGFIFWRKQITSPNNRIDTQKALTKEKANENPSQAEDSHAIFCLENPQLCKG